MEGLTSVAFCARGSRLLVRSLSGVIQLWDGDSGLASTPTFFVGKHSLAVSPDGLQVAYCGVHSNICTDPDEHCTVCRPADAVSAALASEVCLIRRLDPTSGAFIAPPLRGHVSPVTCLAYSQDGTRIASGSRDGTVRLWNGSGTMRFTFINAPLKGHMALVTCLVYSQDGTCIASGSQDNTVRLWNAST
ncbi:WD40 repeat-like protein, partial [Auricularia subglabra TFB-10046 SS5]